MKLGTHIDLIELNNFCVTCHGLRPTGSRAIQGCLKSTCSGIWNTPPRISTHEHQTRWTWSQDIGDANCGGIFWYLEWFARGEAMKLWQELRWQEVSNKSTYIVWFWSQSVVCSVYEADRIDVTIMRQSYSATNWQQEVCHFQNALNSSILLLPNLLQTSSEIMSKNGRCETVKGILISKILLPWQRCQTSIYLLVIWGT